MDTETTAAVPQPLTGPTPADYYRQVNQQCFTTELEFLSSLSSPPYLTYLHSLGSFQSPSFIRYLAHLHQTWSQPRYLKYLRYPNAILFCKALVDSPEFRNTIARDGWEGEMSKQIIKQWAGNAATTGTTAISGEQQQQSQQQQQQQDVLADVEPVANGSGQQGALSTSLSVKIEEGA
jgi:mediator of RNA polymerase II transcription subunit 31